MLWRFESRNDAAIPARHVLNACDIALTRYVKNRLESGMSKQLSTHQPSHRSRAALMVSALQQQMNRRTITVAGHERDRQGVEERSQRSCDLMLQLTDAAD